jgi:hypothetical protein
MKSYDIPKISRRSFLKTSAGVLAASGVEWPARVHAGKLGNGNARRSQPLRRLSFTAVPACVRIKTVNKDTIPPLPTPSRCTKPRKTASYPEAGSIGSPVQLYLCAQGEVEQDGRENPFVQALQRTATPGLRDHLPVLGQSQARKRGGSRKGPVLGGAGAGRFAWEFPHASPAGIYICITWKRSHVHDLCNERLGQGAAAHTHAPEAISRPRREIFAAEERPGR